MKNLDQSTNTGTLNVSEHQISGLTKRSFNSKNLTNSGLKAFGSEEIDKHQEFNSEGMSSYEGKGATLNRNKCLKTSSWPKAFQISESFKSEKFGSDIDYSKLVKTLVNRSNKYGTCIKHRRDIVIKKILRAFRKFISTCFKVENKRPSKLAKPFGILKQDLLVEAKRIGLYHPEQSEESSEEYKEFVCWLGMNKMTKLTKSMFDYNNKAISMLSDVLEKYSHSKLASVFENPKIGRAFGFFVTHGSEKFIESIPESSKKVY